MKGKCKARKPKTMSRKIQKKNKSLSKLLNIIGSPSSKKQL